MDKKYIYALGFFDGVHLGHQALLEHCRKLAEEKGCLPGAITFGTHPQTLTRGGAPGLINTPADRERLLRRFAHQVVTLPFDEHIRTMPWKDFLELLQKDYCAAGFVCGDDFRFGFKGLGNADALESFCRERALPFCRVPEQTLDGVRYPPPISARFWRREVWRRRIASWAIPISSAVRWCPESSWAAGWESPRRT